MQVILMLLLLVQLLTGMTIKLLIYQVAPYTGTQLHLNHKQLVMLKLEMVRMMHSPLYL